MLATFMAPSSLPDLPTSIDETLVRLDGIVATAIAANSRTGYFAALYNRVTMAVRDGIRARAFDNNERMERLDVVFANRYIAASDRFTRGASTPVSWRLAFESAVRPDLSVVQHLLLGINAHINLDLGLACAEVAPGSAIDDLERDFNRINDVLASLLPRVERQLTEISLLLGVAVDVADRFEDLDGRIGNFSLRKARSSAWRFARLLAHLEGRLTRDVAIQARDQEIALLAFEILKPGPLSVALGGADWRNVAAHIRILAADDGGIVGA
jgi:hypothetical protein